MPDLLLEVLSEEIPARMQAGGAEQLKTQVLSRLEEARLAFDAEEAKSYATPRRLALIVPGLPDVQPDMRVERKGPRVDAPEKAIQGFLKSTGLTLDDCERRETPKGPVWFAVKREKGRPTADLLADLLPQALAAVSWPKSMRWEESGTRWVRPIRSILCLLDDQVVPFRFGPVESGRTTLGHRFLKPGPHIIADAGSYEATLEDAKVIVDPDERLQKVAENVGARSESGGLEPIPDRELVLENTGLVEWPAVLTGTIDERFMDLPPEVLRSAMSKHQRYFSVRGSDGKPAPHFIMVSEGATDDSNNVVIAGNERVLRARLADARFFWDQDKQHKLEDRVDALDGVVFHARLGSMAEKAKRISSLAVTLCSSTFTRGFDLNYLNDASRAGLFCKADLVTEMVGEFPDLQGIMGSYYAGAQDEPPAVCEAIAEHYAPQGPGDDCPKAPVSVLVALADKLDTLAGFFAIGERPTGSKDPFALRRAALGVIRLITENELRRPLSDALTAALDGYLDTLPEEPGPEATRDALLAFIVDRLRVHLRDKGERHDLVGAVFAVSGEDDLVRLLARVEALKFFLGMDGANLLTAYRRAANILRIEEKKDGQRYEGEADDQLFVEAEERTLHERIAVARDSADKALRREAFDHAMAFMAELRQPVDAFFDNVTVNSDNPELRRNRLLMLSQIRATLDRVADFSKIEG